MVVGLALFSWDNRVGASLDIKYPETLAIPQIMVNKIYLAHGLTTDFDKEDLIEINYEDQIVMSYCDKKKTPIVGYETIVIIIHAREKVNSYKLKKQLLGFARKVFEAPKDERNNVFLENADGFFKKATESKVLLLGRAGTGKTSIKKIIFEGYDPKGLLYNPLEPTRGIAPSVYSWLDLTLGLFDTSGQELNHLLKDEIEQNFAFKNADVIIYIFDFQIWNSKSEEIIDEIRHITKIIKHKSSDSKLLLFLHKTDLINEESRESEIKKITSTIKEKLNLPIYCTSIYPDLIYSLYNAFYEILSNISKETTIIKEIMDKNIKDTSKLMCFLTDVNDSIIVQTMTKDFNTTLINKTHKLIAYITNIFEDMSKEEITHFTITTQNNLNIIMGNLDLAKFNMKNGIIISETRILTELIKLFGNMKIDLNRFLIFNKRD